MKEGFWLRLLAGQVLEDLAKKNCSYTVWFASILPYIFVENDLKY